MGGGGGVLQSLDDLRARRRVGVDPVSAAAGRQRSPHDDPRGRHGFRRRHERLEEAHARGAPRADRASRRVVDLVAVEAAELDLRGACGREIHLDPVGDARHDGRLVRPVHELHRDGVAARRPHAALEHRHEGAAEQDVLEGRQREDAFRFRGALEENGAPEGVVLARHARAELKQHFADRRDPKGDPVAGRERQPFRLDRSPHRQREGREARVVGGKVVLELDPRVAGERVEQRRRNAAARFAVGPEQRPARPRVVGGPPRPPHGVRGDGIDARPRPEHEGDQGIGRGEEGRHLLSLVVALRQRANGDRDERRGDVPAQRGHELRVTPRAGGVEGKVEVHADDVSVDARARCFGDRRADRGADRARRRGRPEPRKPPASASPARRTSTTSPSGCGGGASLTSAQRPSARSMRPAGRNSAADPRRESCCDEPRLARRGGVEEPDHVAPRRLTHRFGSMPRSRVPCGRPRPAARPRARRTPRAAS